MSTVVSGFDGSTDEGSQVSTTPLSSLDAWPCTLNSFVGADRLSRIRVYYDFHWSCPFGKGEKSSAPSRHRRGRAGR
jgi:hypothetical protein